MTVYGLINLLTTACAADASFGSRVHLWWSERNGQLYLTERAPTIDAECLDAPQKKLAGGAR